MDTRRNIPSTPLLWYTVKQSKTGRPWNKAKTTIKAFVSLDRLSHVTIAVVQASVMCVPQSQVPPRLLVACGKNCRGAWELDYTYHTKHDFIAVLCTLVYITILYNYHHSTKSYITSLLPLLRATMCQCQRQQNEGFDFIVRTFNFIAHSDTVHVTCST